MFKEEYKKHYDEIHPSPELIERTKKMALEQYQSKSLKLQEQDLEEKKVEEKSCETEEIKYVEEEKIIILEKKKRRIIQITAGVAAGVVLVTAGYLFGGTLRQQREDSVGIVVEDTIEPTIINLPTDKPSKVKPSTEKGTAKNEDKKGNKHNNENNKNTQQKEQAAKDLSSLAKMGNGEGVRMDYAANDLVIFHGNFGILGYSLSSRQLVIKIPASRYQFPELWTWENVSVNQEGTKIAWYGAASSSMEMDVYDIAAKTYYKVDSIEWQKENQDFSDIISVWGTDADVYSSKATDMCVKISESKTCQLIYQAPSLSLQASLGIAVVDVDAQTEQIYDVFGNVGRRVAESYGVSYGEYYNENGKKLFEIQPDTTNNPNEITEQTPEPTIEPMESEGGVDTQPPEEITPTPEPTENVEKPEETTEVQTVQSEG